MATIADQIVDTLATAGVKRIWGVVGDSLNGFTDALRRHGGITWMRVRNKEAGAFAAAGEAAVSGKLAVCAGSCGLGQPAPDQRHLRRPPLAMKWFISGRRSAASQSGFSSSSVR